MPGLTTSKHFGEISSNNLAEPSSSSLAPNLQPAASELILTTPGIGRTSSNCGGGISVPGRTSLLLCTSRAMKIRQAPGALTTTQNHLQYYQQALQTLAAAGWAHAGCHSKVAFFLVGDREVQASGTPGAPKLIKY
eukprot:515361-Pelagomonas_calceolata.AAC.1